MTLQEIFTKVATHLLIQNKRSENEDLNCLYRGEDNLKCAIGCLIPDEIYDPSLEGWSINFIFYQDTDKPILNLIKTYLMEMFPNKDQRELLARLQKIHDNEMPLYWKDKLIELANEACLKMPEIA